jgi:hypothetical protein
MSSERKFKKGDLREDGYRFSAYYKRAGKICERWASPEAWKREKARNTEWQRKFQKENPERVRQYSKKWREANQERAKSVDARYRGSHPEKVKSRSRSWRERNPDKQKEATRSWKKQNLSYYKEATRIRNAAKRLDPRVQAMRAERNAIRQARKHASYIALGKDSRRVVFAVYAAMRRITRCIGIQWSVDHIVPLSKGGDHAPWNLQLMPYSINCTKNTKEDFDHAYNVHANHAAIMNCYRKKRAERSSL